MQVTLLRPEDITPGIEQRITELLNQLNPALNAGELRQSIAGSSNVYVLCATEGEQLLGMATLAVYHVFSGCKGWIEDVVVDREHRRKGIARLLTDELVKRSRELDVDLLLLYTGHHRQGAQRLYESCGFTRKDSYLYYLQTKETP